MTNIPTIKVKDATLSKIDDLFKAIVKQKPSEMADKAADEVSWDFKLATILEALANK